MDIREDIISLGHNLSEEKDRAYSLWTWLPSHKAAEKFHGDYAMEYTPSVADIIQEATIFISLICRKEALLL